MSMVGNYLIVTPSELEGLYLDPSSIEEFLHELKEEEIVYIDKSWHAIHFTLTGSAWGGDPPLASVVMGGSPIGDVDVGYGPARGLSVKDVETTYSALKMINEKHFRSMFNVELLEKHEIYPSIWSRGEDEIEYIVGYYKDVVRVFKDATEKKCGLVVFLN